MNQFTLEPANYADYRDFLKKKFDDAKAKNSRFSLGVCARQSKVSKSLLQFVFNKQRHLGLDKVPDLAKTLKLNSEEEYFVYLMLCFNSSRNKTIQNHFEGILSRIRHEYLTAHTTQPTIATKSHKELHLNSLLMILKSAIRLEGFREDIGWLKQNLKVPGLNEEHIRTTIKKLEKLSLVSRNKEGSLEADAEQISSPDPLDPTGQKVFTVAAEAIAELMQEPTLYTPSVYGTMSLTFDESRLALAEKVMVETIHQLYHLSSISEKPTAVVQFGNFMLTVMDLEPDSRGKVNS